MLCPNCGVYVDDDALVCPECGKYLPRKEKQETGVRAIRQGKRAQSAADAGEAPLVVSRQGSRRRARRSAQAEQWSGTQAPIYSDPEVFNESGAPVSEEGFDRGKRTVYGGTTTGITPAVAQNASYRGRKQRQRGKEYQKKMINKAKLTVALAVVLLVAVVGVYLYLKRTNSGQVFLARLGREASAAAYWQVGEERMDTGDIEGAIADFELASSLDEEAGEENYNVSGLLMLASCYEAQGRTEDAEKVYIHVYTDVVPSASDAYSAEIRIMLAQERRPEAAELMSLAYEKTGNPLFSQQRADLLPRIPEVDRAGGPYEYKIYLTLSSLESNPIYYTFDTEAKLPEEGELYTEPIFLDEGQWRLRAVCVNEDLVSNELSTTYRISMPSPLQPYAHLAPGPYTKRMKVALSPGVDNRLKPGEEVTKEKDITIYYTIDGSTPDADSPVYDGNPVLLGTGNVILHAIAVNGYGKASHMLEVQYKIDVKPAPGKAYVTQDTANGIKLNQTGWDEFRRVYGEPDSTETVVLDGIGECRRQHYPWGYASFTRSGSSQLWVEMRINDATVMHGPRSTNVGDTEAAVVSSFRDCSQVESPSGNRGLYYTSDGTGKIYKLSDGSRVIRYIAFTPDSHYWRLDYDLTGDNTVKSIYMLFIP